MREIRFRGLCDGEWVCGYLYHDQRFMGGNPCEDVMIIRDDVDQDYIVKEESIGEWTGLYDKNGKEIYEGDIIRGGLFLHAGATYVVVWRESHASFDGMMMEKYIKKDYTHHIYFMDDSETEKREIIGNIYEDSHLIE